MGCFHKLNYISVVVQYEGNVKWLFSTRNRSQITNIISSEIIELHSLLKRKKKKILLSGIKVKVTWHLVSRVGPFHTIAAARLSLRWQHHSSVHLMWFSNSQVLFYQSQRKSEAKLLPLDQAALLLMALSLPESRDFHWTHDIENHGGWNAPRTARMKKKKMSLADSTLKPQRPADACTRRRSEFVIFQRQCGWLCWSLCVYEVNSRVKCQIYHFGSLNQRRRGAYFFLAKMKCLFTELFTFICSQVVSRINVSGWVNCEMFLWWVCLLV